jgi:nucleoid DNA-binding protein
MILPQNKLDMVRMITEESGRSRKLVEFVIKHFEDTLAKAVRNPVEYSRYIVLKWFGTFRIKDLIVKKKYKQLKEWKPNSRDFRFYDELMSKYYEKER